VEQNHVPRDYGVACCLGWRRARSRLGQVPAVLREDFATGVVPAGIGHMRLGLQRNEDLTCRSRTMGNKRRGTVRFIFAEAIKSSAFVRRKVARS
jgi:hypothetical protein